MRYAQLMLLALLPLAVTVQAEEPDATIQPATSSPAPAEINFADLQQQLAVMTQQRDELAGQLEGDQGERENAQLSRLRQDNQKLKLQLREALAQQPPGLLTETQTWYLLGGLTALLGAAIGALLRGNRRRRQWIN